MTPLLRAEAWPAASSVARISPALPPPVAGTDIWFLRRRTAHIALRLILARIVGIDRAAAAFVIGAHGKPELAPPAFDPPSYAPLAFAHNSTPVGASDHRSGGLSPGPRFSLSHSGARAMVAISPRAEIGVDIEGPRQAKISGSRRAAIIAAGIALAAGAPLGGASEEQQFLQAWVRLEAIAKCSGRGMGRLLGELFELCFELETQRGSAVVLTSWIVRHGEDFPRLTSCYIPRQR